jgi:DNA-binding LytR/AlgR family response regulator
MGANIARKVEELNIPFIFTTSDIGMESVQLFKKLSPSSYLTKPIKPEDLYAAIEICLRNHGGTVEKKFTTIFKKVSSEYFFVRINQHLHRVSVVDITHLESKANYVQLFTGSGPLMVRNTLPGVLQAINYAKIVRVHKSFAVNIDKITMLRQDAISIGDITVPLGKTYRDQLHEHLRFI